jgi:prepilin-type N-terminal cleavage/methylation domain-containing protein
MLARIREKRSGFTLVELMIVVAIIGVLAAIAIPAFTRYVRKARTTEAVSHLNKQWVGSLAYYEADHTSAGGMVVTKEFPGPTAAWESAQECGCSQSTFCPAASPVWNSDLVWQALSFSLPDPHHYMPGYSSSGTGSSARFTAYSKGDLNCNSVLAQFSRQGSINSMGDITGSHVPIITNELE